MHGNCRLTEEDNPKEASKYCNRFDEQNVSAHDLNIVLTETSHMSEKKFHQNSCSEHPLEFYYSVETLRMLLHVSTKKENSKRNELRIESLTRGREFHVTRNINLDNMTS